MSRILQVYQVMIHQGERLGRQSTPGITCPTGLSRVDVVSLPRCQGHTQTRQHHHPCSRAPPAQSSHHLAVPDSLQGHSPRHLQFLSSPTRLHLGTPWELRNWEVYPSPPSPQLEDARASLEGGVSRSQSQLRSNKSGLLDRPARLPPRWGSPGAAGTQAARGPLVTRAQLLRRSALICRGLQTDGGRGHERPAGIRAAREPWGPAVLQGELSVIPSWLGGVFNSHPGKRLQPRSAPVESQGRLHALWGCSGYKVTLSMLSRRC